MQREIKFRFWDKIISKMFYGDKDECEIDLDTTVVECCEDVEKQNFMGHQMAMNRDCEVMQFTGLTDKNGIEIYEGDIIRTTHTGEEKWRGIQEFYITPLEFIAEGLWANEFKSGQTLEDLKINTNGITGERMEMCMSSGVWSARPNLEVIGNVYENPELLN